MGGVPQLRAYFLVAGFSSTRGAAEHTHEKARGAPSAVIEAVVRVEEPRRAHGFGGGVRGDLPEYVMRREQ